MNAILWIIFFLPTLSMLHEVVYRGEQYDRLIPTFPSLEMLSVYFYTASPRFVHFRFDRQACQDTFVWIFQFLFSLAPIYRTMFKDFTRHKLVMQFVILVSRLAEL